MMRAVLKSAAVMLIAYSAISVTVLVALKIAGVAFTMTGI